MANKKVVEAINWLMDKKGLIIRNISNIKYVMIDEYTNVDNIFDGSFRSDDELIRWYEELKQEWEENENVSAKVQ